MKKFICIIMGLVMVSIMILSSMSNVFAYSAPTVYVTKGGTSPDKFNCGVNDKNDQAKIQEAIDYVLNNASLGYTTIHLEPGTYYVDNTIFMGGVNNASSPIILEGEGDNTVITLATYVKWELNRAIIQQKDSYTNQFIIRNLKLDGNGPNVKQVCDHETYDPNYVKAISYDNPNDRGQYYYNLMYLTGCTGVDVYGVTMAQNFNDGLKMKNCTDVEFYNNTVDRIGHDGLYAIGCNNVRAYNNTMYLQTNSGVRFYNTNHSKMYDNVITVGNGGGAGLQVEKESSADVSDIEIYGNTIYNTVLSGIFVYAKGSYSASTANVNIHNNLIYNTGNAGTSYSMIGGITIQGFNATIKNNTIDGCYGWGISARTTLGNNLVSGFTAKIENNIVTFSQDKPQSGNTNYGIRNELSTGAGSYTFELKNNCVFGNDTNYQNASGSTDIVLDPLYADRANHDYHLKSTGSRWKNNGWVYDQNDTSPCINAGVSTDDASLEPPDTVQRINIGRYGNTAQASTIQRQSGATAADGGSETSNHNPVADAFVRGGTYANTNYGTSGSLEVKYDPNSDNAFFRKSYLKFNFSDISLSIQSARLRLYVSATDGDASTVKLYGNSTESWTETGITWNNAPAASTYIASISVSATADQWYEVDVTSYINNNLSDKLVSFELINEGPFTDGNKTTFSSREVSTNKPQLIFTTTGDPTPTPTPTPTGTVTYNPSADAFVRGGTYVSTNYGASSVLEVKYDPNSSNSYFRKSYLKFNYCDLTASSVTNAKLKVYVSATDGDASTIKLYGNSTENWTETGITWNNAPAASTYIASISVSATAGCWYEADVTSYINNNMCDKLVSFELINEGPFTDGNKTTFSSKEASSNKPQLVITY